MQCPFKTIILRGMLGIALFGSPLLADEPSNEDILVRDNTAFTVALYHKLSASDGNLFFSPYSMSTALAMTYAGARGNTAREMAAALRFSLASETLHAAFAGLESRLNALQDAGHVKLSIANSLWPQRDFGLRDAYLALVRKHYGVTITPVDYRRAADAARLEINRWVEDKTQNKIQDLIQPGVLDILTRLVLVNAIYFKGNWESQFEASRTRDAPFHRSPEVSVAAPMMTQKGEFGYAETGTLQVLELPYAGDELSMIVLLPRDVDGLGALESSLTAELLKQRTRRLGKREVRVFLPRFKMTCMFRLDAALQSMGMVDAFSDSKADFSGMAGPSDGLYIGAVLHKAFVDVNEEGTEAAAATAVVMKLRAMPAPPPTFRADHPFLFLIRENRTGSILFMGRVTDPTNTGT